MLRFLFQASVLSGLLTPLSVFGQVQVTTNRYDNARTGANLNEAVLNTSNVNVASFGKLFSYPVNGQIYAQPLYLANVPVPGKGVRNVVYVCTMNNMVYAFDADGNTASGPLWSLSLGTPVPYTDIVGNAGLSIIGNMGIESTPVIDASSNTLYLLARTKENGGYVQRLHALDVTTGVEKFGGPVQISATVSGTGEGSSGGSLPFDPKWQMQRAGLGLVQGKIVIAWGSHEDISPYHGWVMFYDSHTLQLTSTYVTTPNGVKGAIWQSGRAPVVDASGAVYFASANGDWNGVTNFGDSLLKISTAGALLDYFTPSDQQTESINDLDFGSSGPLLIPGSNLIVTGDKEGIFSLVNTANLGKLQNGNAGLVQQFQAAPYRIMSGPAYWDFSGSGMLYHWGEGDNLKAFKFNGQSFQAAPAMQGLLTVSGEGAMLTISANGTTPGTGLLWTNMPTTVDPGKAIAPGILRAFDASNITTELWNSQQNATRDDYGNLAKFNTAVVANGKVFVPTFSNQLVVYGLLHPVVTTTSLPSGVQGASYGAALAATGGALPYTWSVISGNLPQGLTLASNGVISGTPTAGTTSSFVIQVSDANGNLSSQSLSIAISGRYPMIVTNSLAGGTAGVSYNATLTASGGTPPYTWTLAAGELPYGLWLAPNGSISGTPIMPGGGNLTVRVMDSKGMTASQSYTITIVPAPCVGLSSFSGQQFSNNTPAGSTLWFNSNADIRNVPSGTTLSIRQSTVTMNGATYAVPDADITFSNSANCSSTTYNASLNRWITMMPASGDDEVFLTGLALPVSSAIGRANATWNMHFYTNGPLILFNWKWGAAAFQKFSTNLNALQIKPGHLTSCSFKNGDHAGTPEAFQSAIQGGTGVGGSNCTGGWSATVRVFAGICPF